MATRRSRIRELKQGKTCKDCIDAGRSGVWPPECMDFDHRPGEIKLGHISDFMKIGDEDKLEKEIAKCDLVCSNCHRIRTVRRGQTDEVKKKTKEALSQPEIKKKISNSRLEMWRNPAYRTKQKTAREKPGYRKPNFSENARINSQSQEAKEKRKQTRMGRIYKREISAETREKLRLIHLGKKKTEEHRNKMKKKKSPETIEKMRKAKKLWWERKRANQQR